MKEKCLADFAPLFSHYTELRFQENRVTRISLLNGNLVTNEKSARSGVSARVYKKGVWGFASSPEQTKTAAKAVVQAATRNVEVLASRTSHPKPEFKPVFGTSHQDFSTKEKRKTTSELIAFASEIDAHILAKYPDLKSRNVLLNTLDMEKFLCTSEGAETSSMVPRSLLYLFLTLDAGGQPVELHAPLGGLGHFEDVFQNPADLFPQIAWNYEQLKKKAEGVFPVAGMQECVLDADLAGILAHEAIGHTTEADLVLGGSIAGSYLNREVASPLISMVDYAHTAFGKTCPVPLYIDDEGTPGKDVTIIKDGVLKSFLHSKQSAQHFKVAPTGNARAYQFSDEPLIRMRNTAFKPGKDKLEEMISSVKDGYYLVKSGNGQADTTSEFMFGITLGFEIKKGKIGRAIKDTTISGVAFDVLKTVTMVSDELRWSCAGMCGKKQMIPVGMGGPAIKCRVNIGGR